MAALLTAAPSLAQTVTDSQLTVTRSRGTAAQPTSMDFVAPNDFLVLEKATGRVRRVTNGVLSPTIALDVAVNSDSERGLLGIAVNTETRARSSCTTPKPWSTGARRSATGSTGTPGTRPRGCSRARS
jgi:glucose/arabinose dehydrogenase